MLGWRKKPNEKLYAERIYEALADGEIGDMTAEKLRLPKETRARYGENTLHYREAVTLCALLEVADNNPPHCTRFYKNTKTFLKQSGPVVG
jgi:hypothetical protein